VESIAWAMSLASEGGQAAARRDPRLALDVIAGALDAIAGLLA